MIRKMTWRGALLAVGVATFGIGCAGGGSESEPKAAQDGPVVPAAEPAVGVVPGVMAPEDLVARLESGEEPVILDVRSPEEYSAGHIPGAINVPYDQIGAYLDSLEGFRGQEVVVYCRTGRRAGIAEAALAEAGFTQVFDLEGHMQTWQAADHPVAVPAADCC